MDMASMSMDMSAMASATSSMSMDMASMSSAMSSMSMDMASHVHQTMSHAMSAAATATSTAMDMGGMNHGGMDHGGHGGMKMGGCKISMLWNWNTIDACFISKQWHITTTGMFAGTCIGVFAWILALEALRRAQREFDQYILRTSTTETVSESVSDSKKSSTVSFVKRYLPPNLWQQAVRSLLYTVEFGASYLLMLMAMYYNGYVLITMWVSAFISYFLFSGDTVGSRQGKPCC